MWKSVQLQQDSCFIICIFELYRDESTTYTWRHYDEVFHKHKATAPVFPWEICDSEFIRKASFVDSQAAAMYKRLRESRGQPPRGRGRGRGGMGTVPT